MSEKLSVHIPYKTIKLRDDLREKLEGLKIKMGGMGDHDDKEVVAWLGGRIEECRNVLSSLEEIV